MKKSLLWVVLGCLLVSLLFSCAGMPLEREPEIAGPYFEPENSGRYITLTVNGINGERLRARDEYLLDMIQGLLKEFFGKYSEMNLIEFQTPEPANTARSENVRNDTESDGDDASENVLSNRVTLLTFMLGGRLVAVSDREFNLNLTITVAQTGVVAAVFNQSNVDIKEIRNGKAVGKAVASLLSSMGVALTENGELALELNTQNSADAQIKLARSRAASGNIERLVNAYSAADRNPALPGAAQQLQSAIEAMSTGDLGTEIQNDYAQQQEWLKQLKDFEIYFRDYAPFDIVYTLPHQLGETNYTAGTADLEFIIGLQPSAEYSIMQRVLRLVIKDLNNTKNRAKWGFGDWPGKFEEYNLYQVRKFTVTYALYNELEREIFRNTVELSTQLNVKNNRINFDATQRVTVPLRGVRIGDITDNMEVRLLSIDNGIEVKEIKDAEDDGFWALKRVDTKRFPRERIVTISNNERKIVHPNMTAAVAVSRAPRQELPFDKHRMGVGIDGLIAPTAFEQSGIMASFEYGYSVFTVEALFHLPVNRLMPNEEASYNFSAGGGIGASWVTRSVIPSLTLGITAVGLNDTQTFLAVPYSQIRLDVIPERKGGVGFRVGIIAEFFSPEWNDKYDEYFSAPLINEDNFLLNGKVLAGIVIWL